MSNTKTIKKSSLAPTVVLSGKGGFVTIHLAQAFLLKKCRVVVLQKVSPDDRKSFSNLLKDPKFALFDADINEKLPPQLESADYIVHFSDIFPLNADNVDLDSIVLSTLGTKNILDFTRASNAKFCLVAPAFTPVHTENEIRVSEKDLDKLTSSLVWEYQNKWLIDVRIARMPNIYGVGMDLNSCASLGVMFGDLLSGTAIDIHNDGIEKEHYLYVSDAVSAILKALLSSKTSGGEFTFLENRPRTVLETAYIIRSLADGKLGFNFLDARQSPKKSALTKAYKGEPTSVFGWVPRVEFKDGIIKTLKSLGYKPNLQSFKAASLIEEKIMEKASLKTVYTDKERQQLRSIAFGPENLGKSEFAPLDTGFKRRLNYLFNLVYRFFYLGRKKAKDKVITSSFVKEVNAKKTSIYVNTKVVLSATVVLAVLGAVLVGVPLFISAKNSVEALESLQAYRVEVLKLNMQDAGTLSNTAYVNINRAKKSYAKVGWFYKAVGKDRDYYAVVSFLQSGSYSSRALYNLSMGLAPSSKVWLALKPGGTTSLTKADFGSSQNYLSLAKQDINLALAEAKNVDPQLLPKKIRSGFADYQNSLQGLQNDLNFVAQVMSDMPTIFGIDGERNYLVLFQNQNELRPTGGFIGSYATIKLKDGKVLKIEIDDIYNPDGQLSMQPDESALLSPITTYLKENRNYIRNANWHPEFLQSSAEIKRLFSEANNTTYDGVLALDLDVVKSLLDILGPIYIPAYNEQISSVNLYERTQFHSEFDYNEGESSKKAFLTVLGGKILERLFTLEENKLPEVFSAFSQSLSEKHLLLDFSGTYLSKYFQEKNWDGGLVSTVGDYLYIVDANIGGTKANYFVDQEVSYGVTSKTRDGLLRADLELEYTHKGKDNVWPGGPYTDYLRVLTQKGTKLTGAWLYIDDFGLAPQKTELNEGALTPDVMGASSGLDIMDKITIANVGSYVSFETPFTLNPRGNLRIVLQYDLPTDLSITKENLNYSLYWQKQPGAKDYKSKFLFSAPFGTNFVQTPLDGKIDDGIYDRIFNLEKDTVFKLGLK